jgi:hypothetical protein
MSKNHKILVVILAICFSLGAFSVAQGKKLPANVEKWLKENKIGPFTEDKVDSNHLPWDFTKNIQGLKWNGTPSVLPELLAGLSKNRRQGYTMQTLFTAQITQAK